MNLAVCVRLSRAALALALTLVGWIANAVAAPAAPTAPRTGVPAVVVGVLADQPPYQIWPEGGRPAGVDIELLEHLAAPLGWRLQYRRYAEFGPLLDDLRAGRVDLATSMARTPQRGTFLAFSEPYGAVQQALVTRVADPSGSMAPDLLGRSIAVVQGFASEEKVAQLFPLASQVPVRSIEEGLRAVQSGRADVMLELQPVLISAIERLGLDGLAIPRSLSTSTSALHFAAPLLQRELVQALSNRLERTDPAFVAMLTARWQPQARRVRVAGVDPVTQDQRDALARLLSRPVVAVAQRGDRPFTFADPSDTPVGLSVDLARAWLARLGAGPVTWRWMTPDAALEALRAGEVDAAVGLDEPASALREVAFIGPFLEYPMAIIGPAAGAAFDLDQLYGQRIAIPPDHLSRPLIESRHPSIRLVGCPDVQACIDTVVAGRADATLTDVVSAANALAERPRAAVQIIGTESALRRGHTLAVAPRHAPWMPALQATLDQVMAEDLPGLKARWLVRQTPQAVVRAFVRRWGPVALLLAALLGVGWWLHTRLLRSEIHRTRDARHAAEAAQAASRRFTAFLAHEVRNSLHSVIAGARLIEDRGSRRDALPAALGESARGTLMLLNNLLERERLDAGRIALHRRPGALEPILQAVLDELTPAAMARGLHLRLDDASAGAWYQVDALRLQQVVRNLLANAIRHCRDSEVLVTVAALHGRPGMPRLEVQVVDRGPGIPADQLERVFEPFYTGAADGAAAPGTGLGLALCRDLARLMGGDLTLDSVVGRGTTARLVIEAAAAVAPPPVPSAVDPADPPGRRPWVLLVEDAEPYALVLEAAWQAHGWCVRRADSVADALAALESAPVDLVLSDLHLPDGHAQRLLAAPTPARGVNPPVVLMSAEIADADPDALLRQGARGVLVKSPDAAQMVRAALEAAERGPALAGAATGLPAGVITAAN
jgi:two-component system, NarL family, sensor histidine kinase EvgS